MDWKSIREWLNETYPWRRESLGTRSKALMLSLFVALYVGIMSIMRLKARMKVERNAKLRIRVVVFSMVNICTLFSNYQWCTFICRSCWGCVRLQLDRKGALIWPKSRSPKHEKFPRLWMFESFKVFFGFFLTRRYKLQELRYDPDYQNRPNTKNSPKHPFQWKL